jgi:hypothetical protein
MEDNGFSVQVEDIQDLTPVKAQYQVPPQLQSCHTAIVDGYIIEGHVPVAEINRVLAERPDIIGLAMAGMPIGSPGGVRRRDGECSSSACRRNRLAVG